MRPTRTVDPVSSLAFAAVVLALGFGWDREAMAQARGDEAAARSLFDDALADMKAGRWSAACPKLERGVLLDPGTGMRHNLALCYEHTGRPASAWSLFIDVEADARTQGQTARAQTAKSHAQELEKKLSFLFVEVSDAARLQGLEVRRDGKVLRPSNWGVKLAVDPGTHRIQVKAPKRRDWMSEVPVLGEGEVVRVVVPVLQDESDPGKSERETDSSGVSPTRKAAIVAGSIGVLGVVAGSFFGIRALSRNSESNGLGCSGNLCNEEAAEVRRDARADGNRSTVAFVVGAVGIATGATLWLIDKPADRGRVGMSPGHEAGVAGFTLRGAW